MLKDLTYTELNIKSNFKHTDWKHILKSSFTNTSYLLIKGEHKNQHMDKIPTVYSGKRVILKKFFLKSRGEHLFEQVFKMIIRIYYNICHWLWISSILKNNLKYCRFNTITYHRMFQFWLYNLQAVKCKKKLIQLALFIWAWYLPRVWNMKNYYANYKFVG